MDTSLTRTVSAVPRVSTIERFHCIYILCKVAIFWCYFFPFFPAQTHGGEQPQALAQVLLNSIAVCGIAKYTSKHFHFQLCGLYFLSGSSLLSRLHSSSKGKNWSGKEARTYQFVVHRAVSYLRTLATKHTYTLQVCSIFMTCVHALLCSWHTLNAHSYLWLQLFTLPDTAGKPRWPVFSGQLWIHLVRKHWHMHESSKLNKDGA